MLSVGIISSVADYQIQSELYGGNLNLFIEVHEATQEDIDVIKSLVDKADSKFKYHTEIQKIIRSSR